MSLTSVYFIIFFIILFIVYYLLPKKCQWIVLLIASLVFYCVGGIKTIVFVIFTATTAYFATRWMQKIRNKQKRMFKNDNSLTKEDKKAISVKNKKHRKIILIITIVLNLSILCFFKYFHFAIEQINSIFSSVIQGDLINDTLTFIIPLGISYYTLQTIGYIVDVYWNNVTAEKNYFKVLLFVSFFPQITQGPISDYKQLTSELFTEHELSYKNFTYGFERMLWGFFKKLVISNLLLPYVTDVFENYALYSGITTLFGSFFCIIQLYADFSGYMDIVCGASEMLGITLSENFNRPFFSKSVSEFWRRWHITLGAWFKKYVYYPLGTAKWNNKFAKLFRKSLGEVAYENIPPTIALVIVWFLIGLWHGANWAFVVWGLLNGLCLILGLWFIPLITKAKNKLHVNEKSKVYNTIRILKTFLIVMLLETLSDAGTIENGFGVIKHIFTNFELPTSFSQMFPFVTNKTGFIVIVFGLIMMLIISIIQRKTAVRTLFHKVPLILRIFVLVLLFIVIMMFGVVAKLEVEGGFLYAQF